MPPPTRWRQLARRCNVAGMPSLLDVAYVAVFSIAVTAVQLLYFFPRFKRAALAGEPTARRNAYRRVILGQWSLVIVAVALANRVGSPWVALGLTPPTGVRRFVGMGIVALAAVLAALQNIAVVRATPQERETAIRPRIAPVEFLLPHNRTEYRWFTMVSITAGVCEELLYRGYLLWALRPFVGLGGAVIAGIVLFGGGHLYQGWPGVLKTGAVAAVMTGIVFATGWVVPAMIVHALVDVSAGVAGYTLLAGPRMQPPAEASS